MKNKANSNTSLFNTSLLLPTGVVGGSLELPLSTTPAGKFVPRVHEPKKFKTVVIDPPWYERGAGKIKRGADRHYDICKTKNIPDIIKSCEHWENIDDQAHLYLWVTNSFLINGDGLWVAKELGFTPKSLLTWAKVGGRIGLGFYFRGSTEQIIFCTRGKTMKTTGTHRSLIEAPRREHSVKPEESYELIEAASPGPYLDIFARAGRPGWTVWGNEV
jgi:N6-adenosine-specific RNA methylase IME4